jgi:hypothetical protein
VLSEQRLEGPQDVSVTGVLVPVKLVDAALFDASEAAHNCGDSADERAD